MLCWPHLCCLLSAPSGGGRELSVSYVVASTGYLCLGRPRLANSQSVLVQHTGDTETQTDPTPSSYNIQLQPRALTGETGGTGATFQDVRLYQVLLAHESFVRIR